MPGPKRLEPRKTPTRGPKVAGAELLKRERVAAARRTIVERRQVAGSADVTQADVDLAAEVLVGERIRPHPRILLPVTGGSLSTVTPLLEDWFTRFALRNADPNSPLFDVPTKMALHVQLLMAQLAATVRDQVRSVSDPAQALIAAAQLGEHQGLKAQIATLTQQRDHLAEQLTALTYRVSALQTQLTNQSDARDRELTQLHRATEQLATSIAMAEERLQRPATPALSLRKLQSQIQQLTAALAGRRPRALPQSRRRSPRPQPARARVSRGPSRRGPSKSVRQPRGRRRTKRGAH